MHYLFAAMIYFATGTIISDMFLNPSSGNLVAAAVAVYACACTFLQRGLENTLDESRKAVISARKQLADHNAMLRAVADAMDSNDIELLRRYWRARRER